MITANAPEIEVNVTVPRAVIWRIRVALFLLSVVYRVWPAPYHMTVTIGEKD